MQHKLESAYLPYPIFWFLIVQLGLQYFPRYPPTTSSTDNFHLKMILADIRKVPKFWAHVEIIEVKLMKIIAEC